MSALRKQHIAATSVHQDFVSDPWGMNAARPVMLPVDADNADLFPNIAEAVEYARSKGLLPAKLEDM